MVDSSVNPGNNVVLFNLLLYIEGAMEYLLYLTLGLPGALEVAVILIIRNIVGFLVSVWLAYRGHLPVLRKAIVVLAYILAVHYGIAQAYTFKKFWG